ncbi:MAG: DinB family protein [Bacteroidetes bacterium]|nr:MAG: DinB family protein [Bacteroidota bacterium]
MKYVLLLLFGFLNSIAQAQTPPALKSILLDQLKTTHNKQEWFVPAANAVQGLTAEQASWRDGNANHSIAQLVNHLIFWNKDQLAKFKGEKQADFSGNNDETFAASVDKNAWNAAVKQLDDVFSEWERVIEAADDAKLQSWYNTISHISTHNAYHIGQIIYIRKQQGSWNPDKGVK